MEQLSSSSYQLVVISTAFSTNSRNKLVAIFQLTISPSTSQQEEREICFSAVSLALCQGQWDKVQQAATYLTGLRNTQDQTLFDTLVANKQDAVIATAISKNLLTALSDNTYQNALHAAASRGDLSTIKRLLKYIPIDSLNVEGKTPLHVAIEAGCEQAVTYLIDKGASSTCKAPLFPEATISLHAVAWAAYKGEIECLDLLVQKRKSISLTESVPSIGNLLHLCIRFNRFGMLRHLLTQYSEETKSLLHQCNAKGQTPLMLAACLNNLQAITLLYKKNANLKAQDNTGNTALHWAVMKRQQEVVQLLCFLCQDLPTLSDNQMKRPIDLVRQKGGDDRETTTYALLFNIMKEIGENRYKPTNFSRIPPRNLAFSGGGPKGIAYVGVFKQLFEEFGSLDSVERVAGTSAGAMTATAIAIGYTSDELKEILTKTSLPDLLDNEFFKNILSAKEFTSKEIFKKLIETSFSAQSIARLLSNPKERILDMNPVHLINKLRKMTSICSGEKKRQWIEDCIYKKTGIRYCTFKELRDLIQKQGPCKHLHVFALRIDGSPKIYRFDTENPQWGDLIISEAVHVSSQIPGVFPPDILYFKNSKGERYSRKDLGLFADGGMVYNLPDAFDTMRYMQPGNLSPEEMDFPVKNPYTLLFRLGLPREESKTAQKIETIDQLIRSLVAVYDQAEALIRDQNRPNQSHIIHIDTCGIGTLDFDLSFEQQEKLIQSGASATQTFFAEMKTKSTALLSPLQKKKAVFRLDSPCLHFFKRDKYLKPLQEKLLSPVLWNSQVLFHAFYGLGGAGKTELMLSFAEQNRDKFSLVFEIHATALQSDYKALASELGLYPDPNESFESLCKRVHRELEALEGPYLLLYDNVEQKIPFPKRGGMILCTSQENFWEKESSTEVEFFDHTEAVTLLRQEKIGKDEYQRSQLIKAIGTIPFELGQMIADCSQETESIKQYLESGSSEAFKKIFNARLQKIQKRVPLLPAWLSFCAYFYPDKIPVAWVEKWVEWQSNSQDASKQAEQIVATAVAFSLMKKTGEGSSLLIHRNTQKALHSLQQNQKEVFGQVCQFVEKQGREWNDDWQQRTKEETEASLTWLNQAHWITANPLFQNVTATCRESIYEVMGTIYFKKMANYKMAIAQFEKALTSLNTREKKPSFETASITYKIGNCYVQLGNFKQAKEQLDTTYAILEKDTTIRADCYTNLASCLLRMQRSKTVSNSDKKKCCEKAKKCLKKADEFLRNIPIINLDRENCLSFIHCFMVAAEFYKYSTKPKQEKALNWYIQAYNIAKDYNEKEPLPRYAECLWEIGKLKKREEESFSLFKKAYEEAIKIYGEDKPHPFLAGCLVSMGSVSGKGGLEYFHKALEMYKKIHLDTELPIKKTEHLIEEYHKKYSRCALI